ncbi:NADH-quinone oxidoreductase subunit A [Candidatus Providencia siddallii]|uniref:NADH-quinone oxidoreductase subunit A n=1 Tax=Candidatus Providencia siddallii TaxID=1715285 RepID=A0A0M6W7S9_9GAMM|nr:NADH-quinone oxidoreductase subunit A [Candidatus Providencia siddallii]
MHILVKEHVSVDILPFIVFIIGIICLCILMLIAGHFLGARSNINIKHVPYESGIDSVGSARLCMSVKFYLVAMFFVIFDTEAIFLFAWSPVIVEAGFSGFIEVVIFILTLLSGLFYLIRIGVLNWTPIKSQ